MIPDSSGAFDPSARSGNPATTSRDTGTLPRAMAVTTAWSMRARLLHLSIVPLVVTAGAMLGCGEVRLVPTEGEVELLGKAGELDFGAVPVGGFSRRELTLHNGRSGPAVVRLESSPPFGTAVDLVLAGGESRSVSIDFSPTGEGAAEALLVASVEGVIAGTRRLTGIGLRVQVCRAASCQRVRTDPATGSCTVEHEPDGTPCSSLCLQSGTCVGGACVGAAVECSDGNACTMDACDPNVGCVSVPLECAVEDPCLAPVCDPVTGCSAVPVADGTSCGRTGCDVRDVCIAGVCSERPAADGTVRFRHTSRRRIRCAQRWTWPRALSGPPSG